MMRAHPASRKKLAMTRYSPAPMTCVIFPRSTHRPANSRDTAIPAAMNVKKNPVDTSSPICRAYIAT